jgi:hypothetical protein
VLYDTAIGSQIASQHGESALFLQGVVERSDHLVVVDAGECLTHGATTNGGTVEVEHLLEAGEQAA